MRNISEEMIGTVNPGDRGGKGREKEEEQWRAFL